MSLQPGTLLRNRYRVETVLGQGGMGAVYRAVDANLGVTVAVKENLFTTREFANQFVREAQVLANLRHAGLPRVTDYFFVEGEGQYLVMDFVAGEDLRERLERSGPVSEEEGLPWFLDICDALAYLHSRVPPILHRDVKPGNIKLTPDGRGMLVDFGLAKVGGSTETTTTGAKAMTPGFSPPEQYGTGRTDARTDVYSLAATMYAAFTARIPEDALERNLGRDRLTPLRERNPDVSVGVARAVERGLETKPDDRFQSTAEFTAALRAASGSGLPTHVRNLPFADRAAAPSETVQASRAKSEPIRPPPSAERRRLWPLLLVAILGVLALFGAFRLVPAITGFVGGGGATSEPSGSPLAGPPASPTAVQALIVPSLAPTVLRAATEGSPSARPTAGATPVGGGFGQIAFASNRGGVAQVYLINFDGSDLTPLTNVTDGACQPAWSPDGLRLAFTSPCSANREIYSGAQIFIMNMDGSGLTPLLTVPGGDFDPTWSPDGKRIAFTSLRDGHPQVYEIDIETQEVRNLSRNAASESQPAWSPSGSELLFVSQRSEQVEIWAMPEQGGSGERYTRGGADSHPDWSHDGLLILFEQDISGVPRLLATRYEDHGLIANRVCASGELAGYPMAEGQLSLDRNWAAMETWPTGSNHDIAVMTINCTNFRILTDDPALDFDPTWRP